jgi:hypothetical protein
VSTAFKDTLLQIYSSQPARLNFKRLLFCCSEAKEREEKHIYLQEGFSRPNALQNSEVKKKLLARGKTRESR